MRALLAIGLTVFVVLGTLFGLSYAGRATGRYRFMAGNFAIERDFTFRGPGGRYGFYELGDFSEEYGVGSFMVAAGRELKLPFRTATSLALSVFVGSVACSPFFLSGRRR
jgi:hypothetical protein